MNKRHILIVDDEEFIRDLLCIYLDETYAIILAADGEEAWEILDSNKYEFATILLDCMMPRLDGIALLKRMKADSRFIQTPVILQTALDVSERISEGIAAGAFYYLTKPVSQQTVCAVVKSAVENYIAVTVKHREITSEQKQYLGLFKQAVFQLKTLQESRVLSPRIAEFFPDPQRVLLGVNELLINAIEHGNLGVGYEDKSRLLKDGCWESEIECRLGLPEYADKTVLVQVTRSTESISMIVIDQGNGFDWTKYLEISSERAFDLHGRGIVMSKMISFDSISYHGSGNEVIAEILL
ncbi:MAG: response regulator [Methylomarinum sp.]|nr:response regulator [Methylomarinum sp.]